MNRKEFSRAYSYWEPGASGLPTFASFAAGYANTKSVTISTRPGTTDVGAGQLFYSVSVVIASTNVDGTTAMFSGCYKLHLASPNAQATPPFRPLAIQSAIVAPANNVAGEAELLSAACL